jgi:hypothetical protein
MNRMLASLALLLGANALAADSGPAAQPKTPPADILRKVAPSIVRVEYTLRYDNGEAPPEVGSYSGFARLMRTMPNDYVDEQRPLVELGLVLAPDLVLTPDLALEPRFILRTVIRSGDTVVDAAPAGYARERRGMFLRPASPLPDAHPLQFATEAAEPAFGVTGTEGDSGWQLALTPIGRDGTILQDGQVYMTADAETLFVSAAGAPLGVPMVERMTGDGWRAAPSAWPQISAAEWHDIEAKLDAAVTSGLLHIELRFRSPTRDTGGGYRSFFSHSDSEDDESITRSDAVGILYDEKHVLVAAPLSRKATGRLEKILLHTDAESTVPARFVGSLKDYGCFVAELDAPMKGAVRLHDRPIIDERDQFLPAAIVRQHGVERERHLTHTRLTSFEIGRKGRIYPESGAADLFIFDLAGELVAAPLAHRPRVSLQDDWMVDSGENAVVPAAYLAEALRDLPKNVDPGNAPCAEDQERRLAWLGVELQPLDQELARMQGVAHLTRADGGASIAYVYPTSPAAEAGIKAGDLLLRLHVDDEPRPIEVKLEDSSPFSIDLDSLDDEDISPDYFEAAGAPWPSAENMVTRALTNLGFGRSFQGEFCRDGKTFTKDFKVVEGPPHFDAAPQHKSTKLGLTVRDLTFEVRRHFQKTPDDPGVIVSKIEPGERAAIAGLRPFEIITRVNDAPVTSAVEFGKLSADGTELRLTVQRMARSRVVRIDLTAPIPAPEEGEKAGAPGEN